MTAEYEYILVEEWGTSPSGKTKIFRVTNKAGGHMLGDIRWAAHWRQYAFWPRERTLYSAGCLRNIADFIDGEMFARKMAREESKNAP